MIVKPNFYTQALSSMHQVEFFVQINSINVYHAKTSFVA